MREGRGGGGGGERERDFKLQMVYCILAIDRYTNRKIQN